MKKFFTVLLILSGFAAVSCNSSDDGYVDLGPGSFIYNITFRQKILDKDPANVAFRLNTLLTTVAESDAGVTVDNVTVTIKDGGKEKEVSLKKHLFSDNVLTDMGSGVWKIGFSAGKVGESDFDRGGEITVDTDGKLLNELEFGDFWDVDASDYNIYGTLGKYVCEFENYRIIPDGRITVIVDEVPVTRTNSWMITGKFTGYLQGNEPVTADWDFEYTVTQDFGGSQSFDDILKSEYTLSGYGEGKPLSEDIKCRYEAATLKYRTEWSPVWMYTGSEKVFVRDVLNPEVFPSREVKYMWIGSTTQNNKPASSVEMGYNNYITTFETIVMTPKEQL